MESRRLRRGRGAPGRALAVAAMGPGGARGGRPAGVWQAGIGPLSSSPQGFRLGVWFRKFSGSGEQSKSHKSAVLRRVTNPPHTQFWFRASGVEVK